MASTTDHLPAEVQAALRSDLTIDITTTGRRSGQLRRIEIWFLNVDGTIYITGTPGRRDWLANLRANPAFTFHLKESVAADLPAHAAEVTSAEERRTVFETSAARWYLDQGDGLPALIADAPMVRVSFG